MLYEHDSPQLYDIVHFEHKLSWLYFRLPQKALARICLTQEVEGKTLEHGTKTMLKSEESPQWAKKPILARRVAVTWLAKRLVQRPDSKGKSLQKIDRFLEILYIFDGNAHEDSDVRVWMKGQLRRK